MADLPGDLPGLRELQAETWGDPRIVVAVLDGPVDRDHPALDGARLHAPAGGDPPAAEPGDPSAAHGTHVTSLLFGQPGSPITGVAPGCTGLVAPIFDRDRHRVPQLDIARAIEAVVEAGAHVINLSGGQYADSG